jgi:hypothetical protein
MSEMYGNESIDDEDQLQPEDTLVDRGVGDVLDEGYSPPDRIPASHGYGFTATEEHAGETLNQRLEQEEPDDTDRNEYAEYPEWPDDMEPDQRAGRLVAPDEGMYEDQDQAPLAYDVGIDGAGASAEEAAMHVEGDLDE